jgi:hypothetical protein
VGQGNRASMGTGDLYLLNEFGQNLNFRHEKVEFKRNAAPLNGLGVPPEWRDWLIAVLFDGPGQDQGADASGTQPGADGVREALHEAQHRAEGPATGHHDLSRGTIFYSRGHPAGNTGRAGGARRRRRRRAFQNCAPFPGEPAGRDATGRAGHIARECPPDHLSASRQRVPDRGGGRKRGTRADHPSLALFGGGPLVPRGGMEARAALPAAVPEDGDIVAAEIFPVLDRVVPGCSIGSVS